MTEPKFHVLQTQHGIRNDLGEMTEMEVFAHLQVRLGFDMNRANDFLSELKKHPSVTFHSEDSQFRLDVQRINAAGVAS